MMLLFYRRVKYSLFILYTHIDKNVYFYCVYKIYMEFFHILRDIYRCIFLSKCFIQHKQIASIFVCPSVQFSSVAQLCLTLCDPVNHSTPGLSVHHQLPEFTQTHVHRVGDAIQPSYPLSSPSPPAPNPPKHQGQIFS